MEAAHEVAMTKPAPRRRGATAEELSAQQREISVSEFFAKNRHLLGFDNPRKALLTAVKEAVDNALDACEEAGILPDIRVELLQRSETRFKVTVRDNGPGIVRKQIENVFGRLLYGSKFHRLKMSRGQQGIGISAAGMYGLMTTGQPVLIISKTHKKKPAVEILLKMDTSKNRADVVSETEHPEDDGIFADGHGTQVSIEMEGKYQQGRQSVDEYLDQTAIANPHARFTYITPSNETVEFKRGTNELPPEAKEILPHPKGIELGTLIQMMERTERSQVGGFLQEEFSRISPSVSREICEKSGITPRTWVKQVGHAQAEAIYKAIQEVKIMAPATDCLVPIGTKALLSGLLKEVKAEFFTACTRPADVYRGNPFLIEVGLAFGGELPKDELIRVIRFANRVPLLYQQSACSSFKAVLETTWKNYGISQSRGSLPEGPIVVMVHMASVWVPFTSESKEAIADYDEIRKEMKLALQEVGRKLGIYMRRRQRMRNEGERRSIFERYIGEISQATEAITGTSAKRIYDSLLKVAKKKTEEADAVLDEEGRRVKDADPLQSDESVIILPARAAEAPDDAAAQPTRKSSGNAGLFGDEAAPSKARRKRKS
jgi:DNA topoisomerase-6 subunit B